MFPFVLILMGGTALGLFAYAAATPRRSKVVYQEPVPFPGPTAPAPVSTPTAAPRPTALVVLGDSLAVGLAPYLKKWAAARGLPFVADAKVGRFTRQQSVASVPAGALVFVSLGTNDATSKTGAAALSTFTQALATRRPAAVVWLLPPATKALPGLASVRATIARLGVLAVETAAAMRADGIHPASYATVARDVTAAFDRL